MNIRTVVQTHLGRERLDVLVAVLVPLVLMIESGYANAWVFAGGHLGLDLNSIMALGRGLFLEALIYACFKLVRVFFLKGGHSILVALVPLSLGLVTMIISAGCNLGWMSQSPEMQHAFQAVALYLPGWMDGLFRTGLGLIFPVGVGVFALLDVSHLVDELLRSTAQLDNRALHVVRSDIHRTGFLRELKKAARKAQSQYKQICEADADTMVTKVRNGDLSFDTDKLRDLPAAQSSVTRINPAPTTPLLSPLARPSVVLSHCNHHRSTGSSGLPVHCTPVRRNTSMCRLLPVCPRNRKGCWGALPTGSVATKLLARLYAWTPQKEQAYTLQHKQAGGEEPKCHLNPIQPTNKRATFPQAPLACFGKKELLRTLISGSAAVQSKRTTLHGVLLSEGRSCQGGWRSLSIPFGSFGTQS